MPTNDELWKGIIEDLLDDFLKFFFPEIEFDLRKGYTFLDKELLEIYPVDGEKHKTRRVDKLIRLFTRTGEERWVLIHVEVQGYNDSNFAKRVYQYYYRISDAFKKPVSTLVIFTDPDPNYKPSEYSTGQFGTELHFSFPVYKVIEQDTHDLERSENPFALIILTVLNSILSKKWDSAVIMNTKISLVRNLLEHNISKNKIRSILTFIRFYFRIPNKHWNFQFEKEVELLTSKNKATMGVVEIVQRQLTDQARREGMEERNLLAIKNMLHKKFSISDICEILEVSPEYVQKVKDQLGLK